MPLRSMLSTRRSLVVPLLTVVFFLSCGFFAPSLLSYHAARMWIRNSIVNTELPLTSNSVYSEIQNDLIGPTFIASMMARDTFIRDWVPGGEQHPEQMTRYLNEIMTQHGTSTAFFVSDSSQIHYQAKGVLKKINQDEPRDRWYFRVRDMAGAYEVNVAQDVANQNHLAAFINYKVLDNHDHFIGAAGVGLNIDAVIKLIDNYQKRYQLSVYIVDTSGHLILTGSQGGPDGARIGQSLNELPSLKSLLEKLPASKGGSHEYVADDQDHFVSVRYIPELNGYLFVDKREDGALLEIRRSLYLNLLICLIVTLIVLGLMSRVVRRYQLRIEALATLDSLTDLPNRRGFDLLAAQSLHEAQRESEPLTALLFDLDHFKRLNDSHGHLAGDAVLSGFAQDLKSSLRQADIICRWGGEEFIVLLKNTDSSKALLLAEKIRKRIEQQSYSYEGKSLHIAVSIGLTVLQSEDTLHSLLARADHALYRAKQSGRNQICVELPRPNHA